MGPGGLVTHERRHERRARPALAVDELDAPAVGLAGPKTIGQLDIEAIDARGPRGVQHDRFLDRLRPGGIGDRDAVARLRVGRGAAPYAGATCGVAQPKDNRRVALGHPHRLGETVGQIEFVARGAVLKRITRAIGGHQLVVDRPEAPLAVAEVDRGGEHLGDQRPARRPIGTRALRAPIDKLRLRVRRRAAAHDSPLGRRRHRHGLSGPIVGLRRLTTRHARPQKGSRDQHAHNARHDPRPTPLRHHALPASDDGRPRRPNPKWL